MNTKKTVFLALILGIVLIAIGALLPILIMQWATIKNGPIAIIGGADMPTFRLLYQTALLGWPICLFAFGIATIITAALHLLCANTVREHLTMKTTTLSLSASIVLGIGIACAEMWRMMWLLSDRSYSRSFSMSIPLGIIAFVACLASAVWYGFCRKQHWSPKGLTLDLITGFLYLPGCFLTFTRIYDVLFR